jgi:hypothetical protein
MDHTVFHEWLIKQTTLDKYTCDGSGCVTEYVWGTCVDLSPGYLYDCRSLEEGESIKPVKCRVRVYKRDFERVLTDHILTDTHVMTVVV